MDNATLLALITAIAQLGVAGAAYRLGSKVAARQDVHEEDDRRFHSEVREALRSRI
jgi:hypothetical protein